MRRIVAILAGLCVAGCGVGSAGTSNGDQSNPPGEEPTSGVVHPVHVGKFGEEVNVAKIVLQTTRTTDQAVTVYDGSTDSNLPVTCRPGGAECAPFSGASCKDGVCKQPITTRSIFYVKNFDPLTSTSTFRVPCDGAEYSVEAYGAEKGTSNLIREVSTTSVTLDANCNFAEPTWNATPAAELPTFAFPENIYLGLDAPYDRYTLTPSAVAYPWSGSGATFTCDGALPISGKTTFRAPAPSAANPPPEISCAGVSVLHPSIVGSGEPAWEWVARGSKTPTNTGGVGFPP